MNEYVQKIGSIANKLGEVKIMEVCGGHTNTIMRYGIRELLPKNVRLISGPGCPVCVTSQTDIDAMIELALRGVKVATYGDMINVPGTRLSLKDAQAQGADVKVLYSIDQIINEKDRVFLAVGFETTTPMTAQLLKNGITVFSTHKVMPPAMRIVASDMQLDGFIDPGHVSTIIGSDVWETMDIHVPQVIASFKPESLIHSIYLLLEMISKKEVRIINDYPEVVRPKGNTIAIDLMNETLKPFDASWRGMGTIPGSGLVPKDPSLDARLVYQDLLADIESKENTACRCGEVIKGIIEPRECPLFGKSCTPEDPQGACMVGESEGACAIAYKYGKSLSEK